VQPKEPKRRGEEGEASTEGGSKANSGKGQLSKETVRRMGPKGEKLTVTEWGDRIARHGTKGNPKVSREIAVLCLDIGDTGKKGGTNTKITENSWQSKTCLTRLGKEREWGRDLRVRRKR